VTTRRLKAAIDLIEPLLLEDSRRSFARVLRRLRRVLGPIRDVDVMLMHLEEYRKHRKIAGVVGRGIEQLRRPRRAAPRGRPHRIRAGDPAGAGKLVGG
jgi:hypothetical protein